MRFRFCGDDDCPDWILAQINTLSRMNLPELSKLAEIVADSIINNKNLAVNIQEISSDVKLDVGDCKAAIAAIVFILTCSVRFAVSNTHLSNELQQIGLQTKHASTLCDVYNRKQNWLTSAIAKESLKCTNVQRFDSFIKDQQMIVSLNVMDNIRRMEKQCSFTLSKDQLEILIHDLKYIYERMESNS